MVQQGLLPQSQDNADPHLIDFVQKVVNNFVRWDLVRFFNDNPHVRETAQNIALYTGRDLLPVETELRALVGAGVLQSVRPGSVEVFSLSQEPTVRDLVSRFVLACDDRNFRARAIAQVVRRQH